MKNKHPSGRKKGKSRVYRGLKLVKRVGNPWFYVSGTYRGVLTRKSTFEKDRDRALAVMQDVIAKIDAEQAHLPSGLGGAGEMNTRVNRLKRDLAMLSASALAEVMGGLPVPPSKPKISIHEACNAYLEAKQPDSIHAGASNAFGNFLARRSCARSSRNITCGELSTSSAAPT